MPDAPRPSVPARRLDAAALERVLARAAELQMATGEPTEDLSEEQLLELGGEVGLSPQHLRQALAEERTRVGIAAPAGGPLARTLGEACASASRTLGGRPDQILRAIDGWMQREECLQVKRAFPDRIVWEARRDVFTQIRRGLDFGGRGYALTRALDVSATVVPVDDKRVLVRLDADLGALRSRLAQESVVIGGLSSAGGAAAIALGFMLPAAIIPAAAVLGVGYWQARRRYAAALARAQLVLEQILDRLERGELGRAGSVLDVVAAVVNTLPRR